MLRFIFESVIPSSILSFFGNIDPYNVRHVDSSSTNTSTTIRLVPTVLVACEDVNDEKKNKREEIVSSNSNNNNITHHRRRKEGWTEQYGTSYNNKEDDEDDEDECWTYEKDYVKSHHHHCLLKKNIIIPPTHHRRITTLVQHRVAWQEQLLLHILHIPFQVLNSTRFYTQTTGPLPLLIQHLFHNDDEKEEEDDDDDDDDDDDKKKTSDTVMIGKFESSPIDLFHPTSSASSPLPPRIQTNNAIVDYLLSTSSSNIKYHHHQQQQQEAIYIIDSLFYIHDHLYIHWIQEFLQPILLFFTFGQDTMWKEIYSTQCIHAYTMTNMTTTPTTTTTIRYTNNYARQWIGRYQAMTERIIALKNIYLQLHTTTTFFMDHKKNIQEKEKVYLNQARMYYSTFNTLLASSTTTTTTTDSTTDSTSDCDCMNQKNNRTDSSTTTTTTTTMNNGCCTLGSYYQFLLKQESSSSMNTKKKMSEINCNNTTTPSYLAILLFSHLADALCNIHVVQILAEFPHLVTFFQLMYTLYFQMENEKEEEKEENEKKKNDNTKSNSSNTIKKKTDLIRLLHPWNHYINSINSFQPILLPSWPTRMKTTTNIRNNTSSLDKKNKGIRIMMFPWFYYNQEHSNNDDYMNAIQIMQRVAIHTTQDLSLVLKQVASLYQQEEEMFLRNYKNKCKKKKKKKESKSAKYGTTAEEEEGEGGDSTQNQQIQRLVQEANKKDQIWISSVIACTIVGYLLLNLKSMRAVESS